MLTNVLLFDLETTGFPNRAGLPWNRYPAPEQIEHYDSCRIVQIGIISVTHCVSQVDQKHVFIIDKKYSATILPDKFVIQNSDIHGITQAMAVEHGKPFKEVVQQIMPLFNQASLLVAHNIAFDTSVLLSELHRYSLADAARVVKNTPQFCTAQHMTRKMRLPSRNPMYFKTPTLTEMYRWFYKEEPPDGLHNATVDVDVLYRCFKKMIINRLIYFKPGD